MYFIIQYLKSSYTLLSMVKDSDTQLWESLGRPEAIMLPSLGFGTIQPILPWLKWIWTQDITGLQENVKLQLEKTNRLFWKSLTYLLILFCLFGLGAIVLLI